MTKPARGELAAAIEANDVKAVEELLRRGADAGEASLLIRAATLGHTEIAGLLIDGGADVNLKTTFGETPLMKAARENNTGTVRLLLDRGAQINAVNDFHATALICAICGLAKETVSLLIDKGTDLGIRNIEGRDAITAASTYPTLSQLLIDAPERQRRLAAVEVAAAAEAAAEAVIAAHALATARQQKLKALAGKQTTRRAQP